MINEDDGSSYILKYIDDCTLYMDIRNNIFFIYHSKISFFHQLVNSTRIDSFLWTRMAKLSGWVGVAQTIYNHPVSGLFS